MGKENRMNNMSRIRIKQYKGGVDQTLTLKEYLNDLKKKQVVK